MFNLHVHRYKPDTMSSACSGDLCDGWGLGVGWGWGGGGGGGWGWEGVGVGVASGESGP